MGIRATTDERGVKVWVDTKGKYPRYTFSLGKKNDSGEYDNFYMELKFGKDAPKPNNGDEIIINDAFMSFDAWTDKEGRKRTTPYLWVTKYECLSSNNPSDIVRIPDGVGDEVPFK